MKTKLEKAYSLIQSHRVKGRWSKTTKEERSLYSKNVLNAGRRKKKEKLSTSPTSKHNTRKVK